MHYNNLFCKVFVDCELDKARLSEFIISKLEGRVDAWEIFTNSSVMSICINKDSNKKMSNDPVDGFLFYPYYLEIEPVNGVDQRDYISNITRLLQSLWEAGFCAVSACDFEDELPGKGGYHPEKI